MEQIEIVLRRAPDDPPENAPEFQEELREFSKSLHAAGVTYSQRAMAFDAIDAVGYPLPEFLVTLGPPIIAAAAALCGGWVQARYGRKVRLKIGDVEAEGRTVEEIESLLKRAAEFRDSDRTKSDDT
jgi:hypothetical protein